jgi:zinc D-Ala-D-Ala carboxypeptidase
MNALILATALEPVRTDFGAIIISSGFRCAARNTKVGGATDSMHLVGLAADIPVDDDRTRYNLVSILMKHGFHRLGIAEHHVHTDLRPDQLDIMWTYYR